jgi:hypothetical protein
MGGSKGGSSSGSINYPGYLKNLHKNLLTGNPLDPAYYELGTNPLASGVVELMNAAIRTSYYTITTASPYNGATVLDPNDAFFNTGDSLSDYTGQSAFKLLQLFLAETPESLYTTYATDAAATAMIAAFSTDLSTEYDARIIPNYNKGYTDINATMSSAYTIGLTHIAAQQTREVAKFTADIKTRIALQRVQMKMEWRRILSTFSVENTRMYIIAKQEEEENKIEYDVKDALWDLEVFQYGNQTMASIAGGATSTQKVPKPSVLGATLSGAAAGALAGASIGAAGGPIGMAGGAAIGGAMGFASTL